MAGRQPRRTPKGSGLPLAWKGFAPGALGFFDELEANNERDWFLANKDRYERDIRTPMMALVSDLSAAFAAREIPLTGDPKRALFRVNRDVRFSRDKRPYKTVVSAVLSRDGEKRSAGVFYVQFGRGQNLAALGFYHPEPPQLAAMRAHILRQPARWRAAVARLMDAGLSLLRDDAVARLPRGFDLVQVGDLAPDLRLKSFAVVRPLSEADARDPEVVGRLTRMVEEGLPLLEFGWSALAEAG